MSAAAGVGGKWPAPKDGAVSVVLVDDDDTSLRILESYLLNDGCEVRAFKDPKAALASMVDNPPDVLVSDWLMQGMDGPDLLKAIRATPSLQSLYCILVTAHDARGRKVAGLLVGADDYLAKPVSEMELLARIRVGLRIRRLERQAMMSAMAATLGHEVNNPLTGIFGFLDLARAHAKAGDEHKVLEDLMRAEEAAERIREVVARLVAIQDPKLRGILPGTNVIDVGGGTPNG
jgi:PleD family two-component response regulator